MLTIKPANAILGATVTGVDLNQPLSAADFGGLLRALGHGGVNFDPWLERVERIA